MKHITLEQAKQLKVDTILYHLQNKNADDSPQRWKVNGKVKLWKRHPERIQVPMKHGLRQCDYLTENDLEIVSLTPYWQRHFHLTSDALSFQRKKWKEGFKTQIEGYYGIGCPYTLVKWEVKKDSMPLQEICTPSSF